MVKIGLRANNWPTDEEKLLLQQHIVRFYGNHTLDEIRLAFDMAITGRLDVQANCYENFSCLYFSTIMNAYRQWVAREAGMQEQKLLSPPQKTKLELAIIDLEYWHAKRKDLIRTRKPPLNMSMDKAVALYFSMKEKGKWSDEFFINMLATCSVPRRIISEYFDLAVHMEQMIPMDKMDAGVVQKFRDEVNKFKLSTPEKRQLGKCMAMIEQLKKPS